MSKLRLTGSTSGFTELTAPAVAGSNTLTLPTGNGSADQALVTNGSGTLSFADRGRMVLGTAVASTSGTSINFTGIPSYVKRITVMFNGVSTNGASGLLVQIGSGTVTSSGYSSAGGSVANVDNTNCSSSTTGFVIHNEGATHIKNGHMIITAMGSNIYPSSYMLGNGSPQRISYGGGVVTLSGTLDRVRITTVNGTDTFDAGSINIMYEG